MTKSWNDLADLQEPDYSDYNNLLIIDANNLSYRWLQRPNYGSFGPDFIRTIQSLSKSYEAARTIVCFDFGKLLSHGYASVSYTHLTLPTKRIV